MFLVGPYGFLRPCSRKCVRPSYGDFPNSLTMKVRAGPYWPYDNVRYGPSLFPSWHMMRALLPWARNQRQKTRSVIYKTDVELGSDYKRHVFQAACMSKLLVIVMTLN